MRFIGTMNIWIWSNGNPHTTPNEYAGSIANVNQPDLNNAQHIFLNTCIPLGLAMDKFSITRNLSVHRVKDEGGFFGHSQFIKWNPVLLRTSYVVTNDRQVYEIEPRTGEGRWRENARHILDIDPSPYIANYPKDKRWNETTGFLTYWMVRQQHPNAKITLVNFGVKDKRYDSTAQIHGIDFEQRWYIDNQVSRMLI